MLCIRISSSSTTSSPLPFFWDLKKKKKSSPDCLKPIVLLPQLPDAGLLVHCLPQPPNPCCWESKRLCVCWTSAWTYLKSCKMIIIVSSEIRKSSHTGMVWVACGWLSKAMVLVAEPGFQFTLRWLLSTQRGTSSDAVLQTKPLGWKGKRLTARKNPLLLWKQDPVSKGREGEECSLIPLIKLFSFYWYLWTFKFSQLLARKKSQQTSKSCLISTKSKSNFFLTFLVISFFVYKNLQGLLYGPEENKMS